MARAMTPPDARLTAGMGLCFAVPLFLSPRERAI